MGADKLYHLDVIRYEGIPPKPRKGHHVLRRHINWSMNGFPDVSLNLEAGIYIMRIYIMHGYNI